MRKFMTKEVTSTIVRIANISVDANGLPVVETLEPVVLLGEIDKEKASKMLAKKKVNGTVFAVETKTQKYKMEVAEFIKVATLMADDEEESEEETEEESTDEPEQTPEEEAPKGRVRRITNKAE